MGSWFVVKVLQQGERRQEVLNVPVSDLWKASVEKCHT